MLPRLLVALACLPSPSVVPPCNGCLGDEGPPALSGGGGSCGYGANLSLEVTSGVCEFHTETGECEGSGCTANWTFTWSTSCPMTPVRITINGASITFDVNGDGSAPGSTIIECIEGAYLVGFSVGTGPNTAGVQRAAYCSECPP